MEQRAQSPAAAARFRTGNTYSKCTLPLDCCSISALRKRLIRRCLPCLSRLCRKGHICLFHASSKRVDLEGVPHRWCQQVLQNGDRVNAASREAAMPPNHPPSLPYISFLGCSKPHQLPPCSVASSSGSRSSSRAGAQRLQPCWSHKDAVGGL